MSIENLSQAEAIKKLKEIAEKARICMFTTELRKLPLNTRPMTLQQCDNEGNLWFISSKSRNKNIEIKDDNSVQLFFMNNGSSEYLSVYGKAYIYKDKTTIEDKWSPMANAWFDGKEDPDVSIIRVSPQESYYWETKAGKALTMLSFAWAAMTGQKTNNSDGREGDLQI